MKSHALKDEFELVLLELRAGSGRDKALRNLSLEVAPGEFFTILGPSGAGKTTILMLLAGFERPDAGEILLEGRPIARTCASNARYSENRDMLARRRASRLR